MATYGVKVGEKIRYWTFCELSDREWKIWQKAPARHLGDLLVLYVRIFQFDAVTGPEAFLAYASNRELGGYHSDLPVGDFRGPESMLDAFVEDDELRLKVEFVGFTNHHFRLTGWTDVPQFWIHELEVRRLFDA